MLLCLSSHVGGFKLRRGIAKRVAKSLTGRLRACEREAAQCYAAAMDTYTEYPRHPLQLSVIEKQFLNDERGMILS
jgi:hypothetical protein